MFKTVSQATPGQAVPGGDGVCVQVKGTGGPVLSSPASPTPASGTVLAVRRVRCGLDARARPQAGDRLDAAVSAAGRREGRRGGRIKRNGVEPTLHSRNGLGAQAAA